MKINLYDYAPNRAASKGYNLETMDIFFADPDAIPLPPKEVRIQKLQAEPYRDGHRVRVILDLTPFQKRPNAEVSIINAEGDEVASASIIETMEPKMEFTLHLRGAEKPGDFTLAVRVFYREDPPAGQEPAPDDDPTLRPIIEVDRAQQTFTIASAPQQEEGGS